MYSNPYSTSSSINVNHQEVYHGPRLIEIGYLKTGKRPGDFFFHQNFHLSLCAWEPQIPVLAWREWNLMWSSVVVHLPQRLMFCACWDAPFLLTMVVNRNMRYQLKPIWPFASEILKPVPVTEITLLLFWCLMWTLPVRYTGVPRKVDSNQSYWIASTLPLWACTYAESQPWRFSRTTLLINPLLICL